MRPDLVTVVVPTYQEIATIREVVTLVRLHGYRVLVVDDGSPDGTAEAVAAMAADDPLVGLLRRTSKQGLGRAYSAGFDRALDEGAEIVIEMDADLSHDPSDLPRLVAAVGDGADLAIGSRYVPGGSTPDWPVHRRMLSRGGNLYARIMLGLRVRDTTAGFRAFRSSALRGLPYGSAQASGYGFQVEMAWRADQRGLKIVEVPVVFRDRELGQSKMGLDIVFEAIWLITVWGLGRLVGRK